MLPRVRAPPCLEKRWPLSSYNAWKCFVVSLSPRVMFVQLMEQRWRDRALTRSREALEERELLGLNPINWSGTLK